MNEIFKQDVYVDVMDQVNAKKLSSIEFNEIKVTENKCIQNRT